MSPTEELAPTAIRDTTHEGWTNKPTWAVSIWINNEEWAYCDVHELARTVKDPYHLEQSIRDYVEDHLIGDPPGSRPASLGSDLLTWALAMVDWRELAEAFSRDAQNQ